MKRETKKVKRWVVLWRVRAHTVHLEREWTVESLGCLTRTEALWEIKRLNRLFDGLEHIAVPVEVPK